MSDFSGNCYGNTDEHWQLRRGFARLTPCLVTVRMTYAEHKQANSSFSYTAESPDTLEKKLRKVKVVGAVHRLTPTLCPGETPAVEC